MYTLPIDYTPPIFYRGSTPLKRNGVVIMIENKEEKFVSSVPRWFKITNALMLILILSCSGYIIVNKVGDTHETTSGIGQIWWADTPEVIKSYDSILEKKELKSK